MRRFFDSADAPLRMTVSVVCRTSQCLGKMLSLASPSGRGARRAERALSVSFADSSPKGGAKGAPAPVRETPIRTAYDTEHPPMVLRLVAAIVTNLPPAMPANTNLLLT